MTEPNELTLHYATSVDEFRRMALLRTIDIVRALRRRWQSQTKNFLERDSVPLLQYQSLDDLAKAVIAEIAQLQSPQVKPEKVYVDEDAALKTLRSFADIANELKEPVDVILDLRRRGSGGLLLLDSYNRLLGFEKRYCGTVDIRESDFCRLTADDTNVYFYVTKIGTQAYGEPSGTVAETDSESPSQRELRLWRHGFVASTFVGSVSRLLQRIRSNNQRPNATESAVVQAAYEVLAKGTAVSVPYRSLGIPGFKPVQTLLFLTDPGDGHLHVTCHRQELFETGGAAVHIEHIDRDETKDKDTQVIEAYRIPAPINVAKVRLHIGSDAPCTAFIGRPVFENRDPTMNAPESLNPQYKLDRLKAAHMTASCCTAMFLNGVSECKIAIERMMATDAIDFMKAVAGNVFRDRHRQYLSAAFNIFTPIYDDFTDSKKPRQISDAEELCRLGIQLAAAGGFDKVTWDGAKRNVFPSLPILARGELPELSHAFWVRTVHAAHLVGLTTYVSAGLEPQHMPRAVYCGLDGVGIGVKLHVYDEISGRTGDFDPAVMKAVLYTAYRAQQTTLGLAAKVLARLARQFFEGILTRSDDELRKELLDCLSDQVELPAGLPRGASPMEIEDCIFELINIGDESEAAGAARKILNRLKDRPTRIFEDDQPFVNPAIAQIRRIQQFKLFQKKQAPGLESTFNTTALDEKMARLRSELSYSDILDLNE